MRALGWSLFFALLNAEDAILTAYAVATGGGEVREANPVMASLLQFGAGWFITVKVAVGCGLAAWCAYKDLRRPMAIGTWLLVVTLAWNSLKLAGAF